MKKDLSTINKYLKAATIALIFGISISGCRLVYKPLSENLGYKIEHLEKNKYKIEYHTPTKYNSSDVEYL